MKVLEITDREETRLEEVFEDVDRVEVEDLAPEVIGKKADVKLGGVSVSEYDAVFAEIPEKYAVFGRVLLETIEEKGVFVNYPSTAFFIMAKKNYLYHVLHEKDIPAPETAVVASEKAVRNVENYLRGPLIARKFENLTQEESTKVETVDEIQDIAEGLSAQENIMIFNELRYGDKYRCLVAGDQIISLEDKSDGWKISEDNLQYANMPSDLREIVKKTRDAIGTNVAEILLQDGKVMDVNPNPDLEMYTSISGKNAFEAVENVYREDDES
jgi:glutathione synthase/RimK-type ligase-like ATP-grasp enzyme